MDLNEYLEKMRGIQKDLLEYLDNEENIEETFINLINIFDSLKIKENRHELKSILRLILKITKNHYRYPNFFSKIEKIINYLKDEIKKNFSNFEIFMIFKTSKRILLFLLKENIMSIDTNISAIMMNDKYKKANYHFYFFSEMKPFLDSKLREEIEKEIQSDYEEKREIGENDSYLCEMIRSDLIDQFISFVNQQNIFLESKIKPSIFETNSYLIGKEITLIEYAAFFGSCQIFKYLYLNKVRTNRSLWFFAIHSDNPEMVHLLEVSEIRPEYNSYQKVIEESIKCHHNEMANYFLINHLNDKNENFRSITAEKNNIEIINLLFQKEDIEIGTKCFQQCKKLTEITIPSTITEIGDFAFYECSSLKKVVIPSSVTDLGNQSFFICPSLTEITIPSSVTRIGVSLFSGCSSLRQVLIPPSIKTIEKCAFFQCTSLENVTIPSSVVTIGNNAFSGCSSLKDLTIPSSVTSIGESAFKNCSLLCQLSLPSSISAINISTFSCCLSIKEITIPNSVSSVEKFAFFCCSALKKIDIPSSVKSIGESAFDGCTSLTEAFIPNSVTFFGDRIFNRCISLNKLTIPFDADIKAIGIDNHVNVIRVMRPFSIEI